MFWPIIHHQVYSSDSKVILKTIIYPANSKKNT